MVRVTIKGGLWRNTEDEILKAAVMKYGKNQWSRIASLLHRKSAKQCKARWFEWLDPSIKKIEWSREEDEKLLHMAKLMPTQWRTIAPIVGRTAAQCLERYECLLDQVQKKKYGADISDDPKALRPGEIDPNPETKPARPDPIDMDEDELEMLSEARARLANTQGKKAKRKAREKQLEEARRLASLQKKRELRAAGIEIERFRRKRKTIVDYNAEIPFEKKPPIGFYDTSEDVFEEKAEDFRRLHQDQLDLLRRSEIEKRERKADAEKYKLHKDENKDMEKLLHSGSNQPLIKRSKLVLPCPQFTEEEQINDSEINIVSDPLNLNKPALSESNPDMTPNVQAKMTVKAGLESLPAPINDYEVVLPEEAGTTIDATDVDSCMALSEHHDAEDLARQAILLDAQSARSMYDKCSSSVKRSLPFPSSCNQLILRPSIHDATELQKAEELIKSEMLAINHYDCMFGNPSRKGQSKAEIDEYLKRNPLSAYSEDELFEAQRLLEIEMENVKRCMDHGDISLETYSKVWDECYAQVMYLPTQNRYTRASLTSKKERIEAMERKLELNRQHMNQIERKANKIEKKLKILLGGYQARSQGLVKGIQELVTQIDLATIENNTYMMLKASEDFAIPKRLQAVSDEVQRQIKREDELQARYKDLIDQSNQSTLELIDENSEINVN